MWGLGFWLGVIPGTGRGAFFAAALLLSLSGTAIAGPFEDAVAAEERGDHATAVRLFRPLAEAGNANAQLELGTLFLLGFGVPQNDVEAIKWFRLSAERGNANAQDALGFAYYRGKGVPQNLVEAAKWFRRASEQGLDNAQNKLGLMYENGEGVPQNFVLAHFWLNLAAAQDAVFVLNRARVAAIMTPAQIAEAQKLARDWKSKPEK